jgi:cation transport regulator ChaB
MTGREIHEEAVRLAMEAYDRAEDEEGDDGSGGADQIAWRAAFERYASERLADFAGALALEIHTRDQAIENRDTEREHSAAVLSAGSSARAALDDHDPFDWKNDR